MTFKLIFFAIIWFTILGLIVLIPVRSDDSEYQYFDTGAIRDGSTCISTSIQLPYWEVEVKIEEIEGIAGRWHPVDKIIILNPTGGLDVNTVSHEVYHMVEDVMKWYDIEDPHVGAYLQGNWTECVLSVVQRQGQFKFAD